MTGKRYVLGVDHEVYELVYINEKTGEPEVLFGGTVAKAGEPLIIGCRLGPQDRFGVQGCPHTRELIPYVLFCIRCWIDPTDCLKDDHDQHMVKL